MVTHSPRSHVSPEAQGAQEPQCSRSFCVSKHCCPHAESPNLQRQLPAKHPVFAAQSASDEQLTPIGCAVVVSRAGSGCIPHAEARRARIAASVADNTISPARVVHIRTSSSALAAGSSL